MPMMDAQIRQCVDPTCRFRFPWTEHDPPALRCPRCGAPVDIVRTLPQRAEAGERECSALDGPPLAALLDNVRSAFNVGSIFRCADGAGVAHLYLCGVTPTPANPKVAKTALGAEQSIPCSHHNNAIDLARQLKAEGWRLWALEGGPAAQSLAGAALPAGAGVVLVAGNEVTGVDLGLLALCERTVAIPMWGVKRSLNVAVAFGVAVYALRLRWLNHSCFENRKLQVANNPSSSKK